MSEDAALAIVYPVAGGAQGEEITAEEAFDRARERMRRSGADGAVAGGGYPFTVVRRLRGMTPASLNLPPAECEADYYLAAMPADGAAMLYPLSGEDDPVIGRIEALIGGVP